MKAALRILLVLTLVGLAAFTLVMEQSKAATRRRLEAALAGQARQAPQIAAMNRAKEVRMAFYGHLLFWQYPARLANRLAEFLCQLDAAAGLEMEFNFLEATADANGFRFSLGGLVRGRSAAASLSLFLSFRQEIEKAAATLEISSAATAPSPADASVLTFVLQGAVGLE